MPRQGVIILFLILTAIISGAPVSAQNVVSDRIVPDTVTLKSRHEESNRFYRRLRERSEDSRLARRLYRALVSEEDRSLAPILPETILEKEVNYFRIFEGKTIRSIRVFRNNVFQGDYPAYDFRTLANSLHTVTSERQIRRNILFKEGEEVSPALFAQNEQRIRALPYLSDAYILLKATDDGEEVDVHVITRDSWSIGASVHSVPIDGKRYISLYDNNIAGSGNRLDLHTYVGYKGRAYGGNMVQFQASNLWGSFFSLDMIAGWGYDERRFGIQMDKQFILPTDFIAGGAVEDVRFYDQTALQDTIRVTRYRNLDGWFGKSWETPSLNSSYYLTARFQDLKYFERPEVSPDSNSLYHSRQALLFSTGIYRETYYRGNMIYGFGRTENIPYGHRFEVTTGRVWSEFENKWYSDFTSVVGLQTRKGYFRAQATINTFWDRNWNPVQSALELEFNFFSNLWKVRRSYVRQFTNIRYLQGFNRFLGEGEQITFWRESNLRGLRGVREAGNTRLIMRNETVLFSPIYFYGFRFAFFGFADFGWIGNQNLPFENSFYSAIGAGVRLKNERLIFRTIQLSFGFAFNNSGFINYRPVRYSTEPGFSVPRFKAEKPEVFEFR